MPRDPELDGECLASAHWAATLADLSRDWPEMFGTEEADKEDAVLARQAEEARVEAERVKVKLEAEAEEKRKREEEEAEQAAQQALAEEEETGGNLMLAFSPKTDGRGEGREMEGLAARGKK